MSKRRQTVSPMQNKRNRVEAVGADILNLTDKELRVALVAFGETPGRPRSYAIGPIIPGTRDLYERKLQQLRDAPPLPDPDTTTGPVAPTPTAVSSPIPRHSTPARPIRVQARKLPADSPDPVTDLPDPPSNGKKTRNDNKPSNTIPPVPHHPMECDQMSCSNTTTSRTPYKANRQCVYDLRFESLDFVMFATSPLPSTRPSYYQDLLRNCVQCVVLQDSSQISIYNARMASVGLVQMFAGVTVKTLQDERLVIKKALQAGCDAVVLSLANADCSDPKAVATALSQVMEWANTSPFFYHHLPVTTACPVSICKHLLKQNTNFQGIFVSAASEEVLLQLDVLGVKIFETDTTKVLRSLAHGVDSFASHEGVIAMPVIRKLKEEYYEGNTSECCRLQLTLCRFCRILRKHGDFLSSLHSALRHLKKETGELPLPLAPLRNEVALNKELKELRMEDWQYVLM